MSELKRKQKNITEEDEDEIFTLDNIQYVVKGGKLILATQEDIDALDKRINDNYESEED